MNRLTDDQVADGIKIIVDGLIEAGAEPTISDRRYVRLAEYEQTGLNPEQIKELQHQVDGMDISQNESYWNATDCGSPICNRCGKSPLYYAKVVHVQWDLRHLPRFCSNCGSTMKEVLYCDKSGKVQKLQIP